MKATGSSPVLTTNIQTMEQKFIITDRDHTVNDLLQEGWRVVSVTAQHVAPGSENSLPMRGYFAVLLERPQQQ